MSPLSYKSALGNMAATWCHVFIELQISPGQYGCNLMSCLYWATNQPWAIWLQPDVMSLLSYKSALGNMAATWCHVFIELQISPGQHSIALFHVISELPISPWQHSINFIYHVISEIPISPGQHSISLYLISLHTKFKMSTGQLIL